MDRQGIEQAVDRHLVVVLEKLLRNPAFFGCKHQQFLVVIGQPHLLRQPAADLSATTAILSADRDNRTFCHQSRPFLL